MAFFNRTFAWCVVLTSGACAGACFFAPGEIVTESTSAPLVCAAGQQGFNGSCREICSATSPCAAIGTTCISVDAKTALCLEATTTCAYLGSDTECAGRGGAYEEYGRGSASVWVPYSSYPYLLSDPADLTDYEDPYFQEPYGYGYAHSDAFGCQGNANYVTVPVSGPVGCAASHEVARCRLVSGHYCRPVLGTTHETVQPIQ